MKWYRIRERILERDNYTCQTCFGKAEDVHHIIPRHMFGLDVDNNLFSQCKKCHNLLEFGHKNRPRPLIPDTISHFSYCTNAIAYLTRVYR